MGGGMALKKILINLVVHQCMMSKKDPCELDSATLADTHFINPTNLLVDCWTLLDKKG